VVVIRHIACEGRDKLKQDKEHRASEEEELRPHEEKMSRL
jgi:hypothetical protein